MGERINKIVTKAFEYDLPDAYLYETNTKGLTATFTYNGPDKIWVFVNNNTKKLFNTVFYTEHDDGDLIPTDPNHTKVCLNVESDALLMSLLVQQDFSLLSTKSESLPNGNVFEFYDPVPPALTYEVNEIEYDIENNVWLTPFPWKKPYMTWNELKNARNSLLRESDLIIKTKSLTQNQLDSIEAYRQVLRDIPTTFDGVDPWKVPFPDLPTEIKEILNG